MAITPPSTVDSSLRDWVNKANTILNGGKVIKTATYGSLDNITLTLTVGSNPFPYYEIAETHIDQIALVNTDTIALLNQADASKNGIYRIVSLNPTIITRVDEFSNYTNISTSFVSINAGTLATTQYLPVVSEPFVIDVDSITFNQIEGVETPQSPFTHNFLTTDWVNNEIQIPFTTHNKTNISFFEAYEEAGGVLEAVDGVGLIIDANNNLTFKIGDNADPFNGKFIVSGN